MLCEEDNVWPICRIAEIHSTDEQMQQLEDCYQENYQRNAEGKAAKQSGASLPDKIVVTTAVIAVVLVAIIGLVVLSGMDNNEAGAAAWAVSLLV